MRLRLCQRVLIVVLTVMAAAFGSSIFGVIFASEETVFIDEFFDSQEIDTSVWGIAVSESSNASVWIEDGKLILGNQGSVGANASVYSKEPIPIDALINGVVVEVTLDSMVVGEESREDNEKVGCVWIGFTPQVDLMPNDMPEGICPGFPMISMYLLMKPQERLYGYIYVRVTEEQQWPGKLTMIGVQKDDLPAVFTLKFNQLLYEFSTPALEYVAEGVTEGMHGVPFTMWENGAYLQVIGSNNLVKGVIDSIRVMTAQ